MITNRLQLRVSALAGLPLDSSGWILPEADSQPGREKGLLRSLGMADSVAAFRQFDFEKNPEWNTYKASLEIPAGKSVDQVLTKLQAKWYKREIDPDFDIAAAALGTTSSTASPQSSTAGDNRKAPADFPHNGEGTRPSPSPSLKQPKGLLGRVLSVFASSSEERLFFLHLALLLFAVLHLQPIARVLSARCWAYFLQTAVVTHGYKVYLKYGAPRLWPFSFQAIKTWMVPASASTDFQYALVAVIFIPAKPIILAPIAVLTCLLSKIMVPILVLAVYHISAYLAKHYSRTNLWQKYGASANAWLAEKQQQALLYNAGAEIGAGFLVVLALLAPPRSFFLVFLYWQFLRMRYWSPDASAYHKLVWSQMNEKFGRYLNYVPLLKMPLGYVERWFQNAPQASR